MIKVTDKIAEHAARAAIQSLLDGAMALAMIGCEYYGCETLLKGGLFSEGTSPKFTVWNANNHQVTWITLESTIKAVINYFQDHDIGSADFWIYDGQNKVGEGVISPF